ncbi:MAG: aldo/keto reductase [Planctomycetota bacterium]
MQHEKTDTTYLTLDEEPVAPALGFGTWQLEDDDCTSAIPVAIETGYRHIDTAQIYGNESEVGEGIESSGIDRDELFITTKLWMDNLQPDSVRTTTGRSLDRLQTDYVDLLLIHWPNDSIPLAETLGAMAELVDEGKVQHIGVSNFNTDHLQTAIDVSDKPIFCNQVEYHPYLNQQTLLEFCRQEDIKLVAYSPLARGKVFQDATLSDIGKNHGKNPGQVALRWHLQQPGVGAIPKSANPDHIRSNFEIFDFELSEQEMDRINELQGDGRLIDPDFAPEWD